VGGFFAFAHNNVEIGKVVTMAETDVAVRKRNKPGPKGKYETHVKPRLNEIYEWLVKGNTDYSIADNLGICHESLIKYKDEYLELSSLYARARTERNKLVMNKMFLKATGEKVQLRKQKATKDGDILDLTEEQYIPPDVNAADLFLRNNDPDYKSAKSIEINNNTTNNYQLEDLEAKRKQILDEIKKAELLQAVDVECFPVEDK
jgi:hypothetical protein